MMSDPIADMLVRIRNACKARHKRVEIPSSKLKKKIAQLLEKEGYIQSFTEVQNGRQNILKIFLRYTSDNQSVISGLRRLSTPGLRQYLGKADLPEVNRRLGVTIISTSQGMLTDKQARQKGVGGEAILQVW